MATLDAKTLMSAGGSLGLRVEDMLSRSLVMMKGREQGGDMTRLELAGSLSTLLAVCRQLSVSG